MSERSEKSLLFRRQYIYGANQTQDLSWKRVEARNGYSFLVHPDLEVTEFFQDRNHFVLLGYILDPENPTFSNAEILTNLAECAKDITTVVNFVEDKSGRFALFCFLKDEEFVINDTTGSRQVFYYQAVDGSVCIASMPVLIGRKYSLQVSDEAEEYINSARYQQKLEPWWPGDSTRFENVFHLMPNHYLDLKQIKAHRFWPNKKIKRYSLHTGTRLAGDLLKKILLSFHNRYPLALSLSGGNDSRVILAACREFKDEITTFTMIYRGLNESSDDIYVPSQIAKQLGFEHKIIDCNTPPDEEFARVFAESTQDYKTDWLPIVQGRRDGISADKVILKGSVAEIAMCLNWKNGVYPYRVALRNLVKYSKLGQAPILYKFFRKWMLDFVPAEKYGYNLLDLYTWENDSGNWQGMSEAIFDLAHEEYSPLSNRKLLSIMLGVNHKYRRDPEHRIEIEIIKHLWADLNRFPFNPRIKLIKKRFYDGELLNKLRWIRYFFSKDKYGRFED